jgi:hypothetical protein
MRRAFPWLLLGAGLVTLLLLVLFGSAPAPPSTHASTSDAPDGTSALYRAAGAERLYSGAPGGRELLFLLSPDKPYSPDAASALYEFVHRRGGTLVYASERPEPELEARFGILRSTSAAVRDVVAYAPGPLLAGVREVSGGAATYPFIVDTDQVPILRGPLGEVLGFEQEVGRGRLVALADPLPLCNGYVLRSDNAAFAADILGLAHGAGSVVFDESHHVAAPSIAPAPAGTQAGTSPWIYAVVWAVVVGYVGLALRGRGFGPPIPLDPPRPRSSAEYVDAVGTLLRRSGGRRQTAEILLNATRRSVARRLGGRTLPPDRLDELLTLRRPELAERLRAAETSAAGAAGSESALLEAARNLHGLEHGA